MNRNHVKNLTSIYSLLICLFVYLVFFGYGNFYGVIRGILGKVYAAPKSLLDVILYGVGFSCGE